MCETCVQGLSWCPVQNNCLQTLGQRTGLRLCLCNVPASPVMRTHPRVHACACSHAGPPCTLAAHAGDSAGMHTQARLLKQMLQQQGGRPTPAAGVRLESWRVAPLPLQHMLEQACLCHTCCVYTPALLPAGGLEPRMSARAEAHAHHVPQQRHAQELERMRTHPRRPLQAHAP